MALKDDHRVHKLTPLAVVLAALLTLSAAQLELRPSARAAEASGIVQGVLASAPLLSYQGRLLDPTTGSPKPDSIYPMTFSLYGVETLGSPLWSEGKDVTVSAGVFSTLLGDATPLDLGLFDGRPLWLGVTVGTDREVAPRLAVAYVPYALHANHAGNADTLDGFHADALANLKFFTLEPYAAFLNLGAHYDDNYGPYSGMHLPHNGTPAFAYGFTIPPDYTPGTPLTVRLVWVTASARCVIELDTNFLSAGRVGRIHISGPNRDDGLVLVGGAYLEAPATANVSSEKLVQIVSPNERIPLRPLDSILFGLFRNASAGEDTCAEDMVIQSVSISYQ